MSFVFISHASQDKRRIKPIVDKLLAAGLKVFLDNPDKGGYRKKDIESGAFFRLHYDRPWESQIREALQSCSCILVCWSKRATAKAVRDGDARRVWLDEIGYARNSGKAVNCAVDSVDFGQLPGVGSNDNICNLNTSKMDSAWHAAFALILEDVRRKVSQPPEASFPAQPSWKIRNLPLLVDRDAHEAAFWKAIQLADAGQGVQPIVLKGPINELPLQFLERIDSLTAVYRPTSFGSWDRVWIKWPRKEKSPSDFIASYQDQLSVALSLKEGFTLEGLAAGLERKGLIALTHQIDASRWRAKEEPAFIAAWLDLWGSLNGVGRQLKVVPILLVPLPVAKPGWQARDFPKGTAGGSASIREIWHSLGSIAQSRSNSPRLQMTPVLAPIEEPEARQWVAEHVRAVLPGEAGRIDECLSEIYRPRLFGGAKRHGVSHEEFSKRMSPLCKI